MHYGKCRPVAWPLEDGATFVTRKGVSVRFGCRIPEAAPLSQLLWVYVDGGGTLRSGTDGRQHGLGVAQSPYDVVQLPLFWLGDQPMYRGDVVYTSTEPTNAKGYTIAGYDVDRLCVQFKGFQLPVSFLTTTPPAPQVLCTLDEVDIVQGDTVYSSRPGDFGREWVVVGVCGSSIETDDGSIPFMCAHPRRPICRCEGRLAFAGDIMYTVNYATRTWSRHIISDASVVYDIRDTDGNTITIGRVGHQETTWIKPVVQLARIVTHRQMTGARHSQRLESNWMANVWRKDLHEMVRVMNELHGDGSHWIEEPVDGKAPA